MKKVLSILILVFVPTSTLSAISAALHFISAPSDLQVILGLLLITAVVSFYLLFTKKVLKFVKTSFKTK